MLIAAFLSLDVAGSHGPSIGFSTDGPFRVLMMSRLLLSVGLIIGMIGGAIAQDDMPPVPFRPGDSVKVNLVTPEGSPGSITIYSTVEDAKRQVTLGIEATRAGRSPSTEGLVSIGHNTPGIVQRVEVIEADGKSIPFVEVTLGLGALKGQRYWISARRLRGFDELDPAAGSPHIRSVRELMFDPEYQPKAGDSVVLAWRQPGSKAPLPVGAYPGALTPRAVSERFAALVPGAPTQADFLLLAPGTEATINKMGRVGDETWIRVQLDSGPFAGLTCWVRGVQVSRPDVFERTSPERKPNTR
jgi:hypothetical protein